MQTFEVYAKRSKYARICAYGGPFITDERLYCCDLAVNYREVKDKSQYRCKMCLIQESLCSGEHNKPGDDIKWIPQTTFRTFIETHEYFCTYMPNSGPRSKAICCAPIEKSEYDKALKDRRCKKCTGFKGKFETWFYHQVNDKSTNQSLWLTSSEYTTFKDENTHCTYSPFRGPKAGRICCSIIDDFLSQIPLYERRCSTHLNKLESKFNPKLAESKPICHTQQSVRWIKLHTFKSLIKQNCIPLCAYMSKRGPKANKVCASPASLSYDDIADNRCERCFGLDSHIDLSTK